MNHSMRLPLLASAIYLCFNTFAGAESQAAADSTAAQASSSVAASNEAAAKHAKRTACLKEAKDKKLIGADKNSFLKTCLASPSAGP